MEDQAARLWRPFCGNHHFGSWKGKKIETIGKVVPVFPDGWESDGGRMVGLGRNFGDRSRERQ
jgi:hypothetical protein